MVKHESGDASFWGRLEDVCRRCDVLQHPFYVRWSAGTLTLRELSIYAEEYHHAVRALARLVLSAAERAPEPARSQLRTHAAEEMLHVGLWGEFADALPPVERSVRPSGETMECVETWTGTPTLLHALVAMYAIESGQARVAATKRATLPLYGLDGPECTYFDVHAHLDQEHAASTRALIVPLMEDLHDDRLHPFLDQAQAVLRANWRLLDGVERRNSEEALTVPWDRREGPPGVAADPPAGSIGAGRSSSVR